MTKTQIVDQSHAWRTEVPNSIVDLKLTPHEFRLYVQLKRVAGDNGKCWQSTRTLAQGCNMSVGAVSNAKIELLNRGLITIERRDTTKGQSDIVRITDIWVQNYQKYNPQSVQEVNIPVQEVNTPVQEVKQRRTPKEKKNTKLLFPAEIRNPMMELTADICAMDMKLTGVPAQLNRVVTSLLEADYTIEDLERWFREFWPNDWRGQKGQRPKPHDILSEIGKLRNGALSIPQTTQLKRDPRTGYYDFNTYAGYKEQLALHPEIGGECTVRGTLV